VNRQIITLATYVIIEALRTRFFVMILMLLFIGFGLTLFVGEIALIESQAIQSSLLGAFLRLSAIYVVSLFVITSIVREFNDNSIYLLLSFPIQRSHYFFGKLCGFIGIALMTTLIFSLALMGYSPYPQVLFWGLSLFCELLIMTTLSFLSVLTFQQTIQSFSFLIGFYILARSMSTIQLMAQASLSHSSTWSDVFIAALIHFLATLLPNLDRFTPAEWLVYSSNYFEALLEIIMQTIIYGLLLIAMSLFDLYRKNL